MKKRPSYIDQRVADAICMLHEEGNQRPENRAECSYRIVVLTCLSFLYDVASRISTLLFFGFGLFAGLFGALLLKAVFLGG